MTSTDAVKLAEVALEYRRLGENAIARRYEEVIAFWLPTPVAPPVDDDLPF